MQSSKSTFRTTRQLMWNYFTEINSVENCRIKRPSIGGVHSREIISKSNRFFACTGECGL